jgi:hypothetical protein
MGILRLRLRMRTVFKDGAYRCARAHAREAHTAHRDLEPPYRTTWPTVALVFDGETTTDVRPNSTFLLVEILRAEERRVRVQREGMVDADSMTPHQ